VNVFKGSSLVVSVCKAANIGLQVHIWTMKMKNKKFL